MSQEYKSFSEREGYAEPKPIQIEEMDDRLRNRLWNEFYKLLNHLGWTSHIGRSILLDIWVLFKAKPEDEFDISNIMYIVKEFFLKEEKWSRVYDLVEFIAKRTYVRKGAILSGKYIANCNISLKAENSAYTIINGLVTPIVDEHEIESIKRAYDAPFETVRRHIFQSHVYLANRQNPDYLNSIKEAISAVEGLAREVTGMDSGTLKNLLHDLPLQHKAFKDALDKLYGFTGDAGGIRHSNKPNENLPIDQNTARFMLVICSAFVNYIISQSPELENNEPEED